MIAPKTVGDALFAEPELGATLAELIDYLSEQSQAGIAYLAETTEDLERAALAGAFTFDAVLRNTRAGVLTVRGRRLDRGTVEDIPLEVIRSERLDFDPTADHGRGRMSVAGSIWRDLRFNIDQIVKLWPAPLGVIEQSSDLSQPADGEQEPPPRKKRGRPPGSGGWVKKDQPFVTRMRKLIKSNKAGSPHAAAYMVLPDIKHGTSTPENIAKRLCEHYGARYS